MAGSSRSRASIASNSGQFYIGQIIDFDGTLEPEIQGVNIGSFIRFREEQIFSCRMP